MATVTKGKDKGLEFTIHQFCNDWFISRETGKVLSPTSVKLDPEEIKTVRGAAARGLTGKMFDWYDLMENGTFRKRRTLR